MPSDIVPTPTLKEYLLSNGTRVVSEVPVNFYSDSEILKIEIAGAILIIAVGVITWALYSLWKRRYNAWVRQKDLEDRVAAGEEVLQSDYPLPEKFNRAYIFVVGGLVILAGIVVYVMP